MQTKEMFVFAKNTVQLNSAAFYSGKKPNTEQMKIRKKSEQKDQHRLLAQKGKELCCVNYQKQQKYFRKKKGKILHRTNILVKLRRL